MLSCTHTAGNGFDSQNNPKLKLYSEPQACVAGVCQTGQTTESKAVSKSTDDKLIVKWIAITVDYW